MESQMEQVARLQEKYGVNWINHIDDKRKAEAMDTVIRIVVGYILLIASLILTYRVEPRLVVPMVLFAMAMSALSYRGN